SVRDLTDYTGAIRDHLDTDAFGKLVNESVPSYGDRYKFEGREADVYVVNGQTQATAGQTGLTYNRARFTDPSTNRFLSQDPTGLGAGDVNLYRMAGNANPNFTDPSGLQGFRVDPGQQTAEEAAAAG